MKLVLTMSIADTAQTREEIARLKGDELHALTKEAFFWGMHPAAIYEMRYFLTQSHIAPTALQLGAFGYVDTDGQRFTGAAKYTLTFDVTDLPPVTEFWELPLYDEGGYFIDNEIDRYSINSYMLERGDLHVADGKLVIYIQHEKPADSNQLRNWLPAPQGGFRFAFRYYGPMSGLLDGSYDMPGVVRTPVEGASYYGRQNA